MSSSEIKRIILNWRERTDVSVRGEQEEHQPNWTLFTVWEDLIKGRHGHEQLIKRREYWANRLTAKCLALLELFAQESGNTIQGEWLDTTETITFRGGEGGIASDYTKDLAIRLKWEGNDGTYKLTKAYPQDGYEEIFETSASALAGNYPTFLVTGKFTYPFADVGKPYEIKVECDSNVVRRVTFDGTESLTTTTYK